MMDMNFVLPLARILEKGCRLIAGSGNVSALSYVFLFSFQAFNNETCFVFLYICYEDEPPPPPVPPVVNGLLVHPVHDPALFFKHKVLNCPVGQDPQGMHAVSPRTSA